MLKTMKLPEHKNKKTQGPAKNGPLVKKCLGPCGKELSLDNFWKVKENKLRSRCKVCTRLQNKQWEINNPEKAKKARDKFKLDNPNYYKEYQKQWEIKNPEKRKSYYKKHRQSGKRRAWEREYNKRPEVKQRKKELFEKRPDVQWLKQVRRATRSAIKAKTNYYIIELGCTTKQFKKHIESTWQKNMSWENYGIHGWHIDHIIPLKNFNLSIPEQRYKAANYKNCRALWATENLQKGIK